MPRKALSPNTRSQYKKAISRNFGNLAFPFTSVPSEVQKLTESSRALLRAALKRKYEEAKLDATPILEQIPIEWTPKRSVEIPAEEEAAEYEKACKNLPEGIREVAIIPLAMGLRAAEVVTLTRKSVERAAVHGELLVMRKGAEEQRLPAKHAKGLFRALLGVKAAKKRSLFEPILQEGKVWKVVGEIISTGNADAAYHALHALVRDAGKDAGIEGLRPHKLRHAFATRMARDGAPLSVIQWMLGHSDIKTTMKYIHLDAQDAEKYVREF